MGWIPTVCFHTIIKVLHSLFSQPPPVLARKYMVYLSALSVLWVSNYLNAGLSLVLSPRPNRSAVFIFQLSFWSSRSQANNTEGSPWPRLSQRDIQKSMRTAGIAMLQWQDDARLLLSGRWRCYLRKLNFSWRLERWRSSSFLSLAPEWKVKRPKARAEMMRESMPLNNSRNGTKEFDRADTGKQMKGNSAVH